MSWKWRFLRSLASVVAIQFDEHASSSSSSLMSPAWCPTECSKCDELGSCLECKDDFILQSFECVESCMEGFFEDDVGCRECPIECSQCSSLTVR